MINTGSSTPTPLSRTQTNVPCRVYSGWKEIHLDEFALRHWVSVRSLYFQKFISCRIISWSFVFENLMDFQCSEPLNWPELWLLTCKSVGGKLRNDHFNTYFLSSIVLSSHAIIPTFNTKQKCVFAFLLRWVSVNQRSDLCSVIVFERWLAGQSGRSECTRQSEISHVMITWPQKDEFHTKKQDMWNFDIHRLNPS